MCFAPKRLIKGRGIKEMKVKTMELTDEMLVATDIYAEELLIVPAHTKITPRIIAKLEMYGICAVDVYKESEGQPPVLELDNNMESYLDTMKKSAEFQKFNNHYDNVIENMTTQFSEIMDDESQEVNIDRLLGQVDYLLDQSDNCYHMFDMLQCMKEHDDYTFSHCMNVAVISSTLAHWLRFSEDDVATVILCGLLHDIGKLRVPQEIINKPGRLTPPEFEEIKKHTIYGYNILKNKDIDMHIKLAALEHHEKCDGSGYPYKKIGGLLDPFSKIIAIADVYDAMTARRTYRDPLCPFEVIASFEKDGLNQYETKYILKFLEGIANAYINHRVVLNDGTQAEVILINGQDLSRPLVKTEAGVFLNLSEKRNLSIKALV